MVRDRTGDASSPLLLLATRVYRLLGLVSPIRWAEKWYEGEAETRRLPFCVVESWVFVMLLLQILALIVGRCNSAVTRVIAVGIAVWCLIDLLNALLRDVIWSPQRHSDDKGGFILIRNRARWISLAVVSTFQIPLSFAILFLVFGNHFCPAIADALTALYQSFLTFTTLGYGDIRPISGTGRLIVLSELAFFLLFVVIRIPIAVSVMRVQVEQSVAPGGVDEPDHSESE